MSGMLRFGGREQARGWDAGSRRGASLWLARAAILVLVLVPGCKSCHGEPPPPGRVCFTVNASSSLNFYDGQSHVVVLYVYPLESALAFDAANVEDLLGGSGVSGTLGKPREITVTPGQEIPFDEKFSPQTTHVGLVADYYRAPGDPPGSRKASLAAKCAEEGPRPIVVLSARDLLVK